jgi:FAD/FMN-containing dehydrogenase
MRLRTATYEGSDNVEAATRLLRRTLHGPVHRPGDVAYGALRRPHSPALDPRPALVLEAYGAADVRAAVVAAREYDLPFAVQATGHGTHVACDGGVLVRTGAMATVLVDPDRRVAHVGAGARWADVLAAAAPFGLAPLSGSDPSVGVAGYTLGGGLGWLARRHGFAADSLLRAEVVTAEGRVVTASAGEHPDLHWALRGGGGGFGVVTAMEIALHPVDRVYAGTAYFPIDRAPDMLTRYRDWIATAPDALSTAVLVTRLGDERALALRVTHAGPADEAERLLAPLRAVAGPALRDDLRVTPFAAAAMGGTAPRHLDLFETLPDGALEVLLAAGEHATVELRHWGGALAAPRPDAGPAGHRSTALSAIVDAPSRDLAAALAPYATGGSFLNFLSDPARTETAFTAPNLRRLRDVKRAYDPDEVFSVGHAVAPAGARAVDEARLRW